MKTPTIALAIALAAGAAAAKAAFRPQDTAARFAGAWHTTYGPMELAERETGGLAGTYGESGAARIEGAVRDGRLEFRYEEASERGRGWFVLDGDGRSLAGLWHIEEGAAWRPWTGTREGEGARGEPADVAGRYSTPIGTVVLETAPEGGVVGRRARGGAEVLTGARSGGLVVFAGTDPERPFQGWLRASAHGAVEASWRATPDAPWQPAEVARLPDGPDFSGSWETTYGGMRLVQEGDRVSGTYALSGGSTIDGRIEDGRFVFAYEEPGAKGEGWFELAGDGRSFAGRWRAEGSARWQRWTGTRPAPFAARGERRWLVVLEHRWEQSLFEQEYTFGQMLRTFFARSKAIVVRHRVFADREDFERLCAELAYLDEPVYLVVASHGSEAGLSSSSGSIPADAVAEALAPIAALRLVHFSSCSILGGDTGKAILAKRPAEDALAGVSGYRVSVDWAASALIEMLYLDLILVRGMAPEEAARRVPEILPFAADRPPVRTPLGAAHFTYLPAREPATSR